MAAQEDDSKDSDDSAISAEDGMSASSSHRCAGEAVQRWLVWRYERLPVASLTPTDSN